MKKGEKRAMVGKMEKEMWKEIPVGHRDADAIPVQERERKQVSDWGSLDGVEGCVVVVKGSEEPARAGQQEYTTSDFTACLPWTSLWQEQEFHVFTQ